MKIAIDCRMLTKSGIGVYLENILEYLLDSSRYSFLLIGEKNIYQNMKTVITVNIYILIPEYLL